jgi:hypothetical protein
MLSNRNAVAWMVLTTALALHVLDEATTGFLPFYNETVQNLRERLGLFPMPTFTFPVWIGGLVGLICICYLVTPIVAGGSRAIRVLTTAFGMLMIANALGHLLGSLYFGRLLPGFWSSPLLLPAAAWVVVRGFRGSPPLP